MIGIEGNTADDAWRRAGRLLQDQTEVQSGRDQPTRELLHVAFSIKDPRQRVVFARPFNPALAIAEVIWILAGGNASEFLLAWNPRMRRFLDSDARLFHGAYGFRLGSRPKLPPDAARVLRAANSAEPRQDQLKAAYQALQRNPDSRQVVLQIWNSERDLPNPMPRSQDVPCNLFGHLMIREGRLEWLQVMRSNDLIWGTPINFVQFTCLQEIVSGWLGVEIGSYVQISDSLHVYQRHWTELDALNLDSEPHLPKNNSDLRIEGYVEWERVFGKVALAAVQLSRGVDRDDAFMIVDRANDLPASYAEWIALLAAESLRRRGHEDAAVDLIGNAGNYWAESWHRWHAPNRFAVQASVVGITA